MLFCLCSWGTNFFQYVKYDLFREFSLGYPEARRSKEIRDRHTIRIKVLYAIDQDVHSILKVHNEELNGLYFSPNKLRVMKTRRMRWAANVPLTGERRGVFRFWWGDLRERDHLGDPGVEGRIILRLIFRRWYGGLGLDWSGSGWQVAVTCKPVMNIRVQ